VTSTRPDQVAAATVRGWLDQPDAVTVLDVRTPAEFETAHIRGSYNLPLTLIAEHGEQIAARLDRQVVLVCRSGTRACEAQQHLAGVGADRVHVLDGGLTAYTSTVGADDPTVVRGRARWALERQVRLVAGTLVLAGLAVGQRRPAGRLLAAGIGAGLTLSAVTDTCTLGRLLAALPYNRGPRDRTPGQVLAQLPSAEHAA
jgi:rhodanese-related sulfurtransferase